MRKKLIFLKIAAGITVLLLVLFLLFLSNAFLGNPFSAWAAQRAAASYAETHYSFLNLTLEKARYNFKFGEYYIDAKSPSSPDTHFTIYYKNGKVRYDDYESRVLEKFNTLQRLTDESSTLVPLALEEESRFQSNHSIVSPKNFWESGQTNPDITLDCSFDINFFQDCGIVIRIENAAENSVEFMAETLKKAYSLLEEKGYHFEEYNLQSGLFEVSGVTPRQIISPDFAGILSREEEGISILNYASF